MPFIKQYRREIIDSNSLGVNNLEEPEPGDRCYIYYKYYIKEWNSNPKWATAHRLYKEMCLNTPQGWDEVVAQSLAWQVFFHLKVIPYELDKRSENGDID